MLGAALSPGSSHHIAKVFGVRESYPDGELTTEWNGLPRFRRRGSGCLRLIPCSSRLRWARRGRDGGQAIPSRHSRFMAGARLCGAGAHACGAQERACEEQVHAGAAQVHACGAHPHLRAGTASLSLGTMGLSSSGSKKVADGATATRETPWTLAGVLTTSAPAARAKIAEIRKAKMRMEMSSC
eukprot:scaffold5523_cov112-Isochrysis_galbana.AAC.3